VQKHKDASFTCCYTACRTSSTHREGKGGKKKEGGKKNGGSEEYGANCIRVDRASLAFLEPFDTGNDDLENSRSPAAAREAFLIICTTVLFPQI
jgi:hypothetical protein